MIEIKKILIGGLPVEIIRKEKLKNLYVRVCPPDGKIIVSSPIPVSDEYVKLFVLKKFPEIEKTREKMISQSRQSKREYVSGETYYLWGRGYMLQVVFEGTTYKISKFNSRIVMTVPIGTSSKMREKILTEWYRSELKAALPSFIRNCEQKTGVHAEEFKIRNMRTRWGTCNIDKRRILINLQLVKKPPECLEYVIIHELVHLLEKNHTNRFNSLVEQFCPAWRDIKRILTDFPLDFFEKDGSSEKKSRLA